jgi:transcriptional regulator with XRE-family HTH domain
MRTETSGLGDLEFGRRLRTLRQQRGLSQSELAAGQANQSYGSMLESGKRTPSLEIIMRLAERLGVPPTALTDDLALRGIKTEQANQESQYLALQIRARGAMDLGDLDAARGSYENIYALAAADGDAHWTIAAGLSLDGILQLLGDNDARYRLMADLSRVADTQVVDVRFKLKISWADAAWDIGRLREAESLLRDALDLLHRAHLEGTTEHVRALGMLIVLRCDLGDDHGNDRLITQMVEAVTTGGRAPTIGWAHWSASVAYALMEVPDAALDHLAHAEALAAGFISRGEWAWFCRSAASVLLSAGGDLDRVRHFLDQAAEALRHHSSPGQHTRLNTVAARYEFAAGRAEAAERLCAELLDETRPVLTPVDRARMQELRARSLLELGRTDEAATAFRAAAETFEAIGAYRWSARAWRQLNSVATGR